MRALKIAYDHFLKSGKDVREFTITISEKTEENKNGSNEIFSVMLMGKLSPGKRRAWYRESCSRFGNLLYI